MYRKFDVAGNFFFAQYFFGGTEHSRNGLLLKFALQLQRLVGGVVGW
jgi:hypothetical protein